MSTRDLLTMALQNLWRRKLRSALTMLGVVIGTSSIIIMLSLGFGMTETFEEQIRSLGSLTTITVTGSSRRPGPPVPNQSRVKKVRLDEQAVKEIRRLPGVRAVTPVLEQAGTLYHQRSVSYVTLMGLEPALMEELGYHAQSGRLLAHGDQQAAVVGHGIPNSFTDARQGRPLSPIDSLNARISLSLESGAPSSSKASLPQNLPTLRVVGLLEENMEADNRVFLPLEYLQKLRREKASTQGSGGTASSPAGYEERYSRILVKAPSMDQAQPIQQRILDLGYNAFSMNDFLLAMQRTSNILQAILGGLGSISLLVAAIGITNTMVMSIHERTREIGVMKVIGASLSDIRRLFLTESLLIGLVGGLVGIALSLASSRLLNYLVSQIQDLATGPNAPVISIVPGWLVLAATVFSALMGVVAGYYPARKAMQLSVLEAIRSE